MLDRETSPLASPVTVPAVTTTRIALPIAAARVPSSMASHLHSLHPAIGVTLRGSPVNPTDFGNQRALLGVELPAPRDAPCNRPSILADPPLEQCGEER